jgi:hypothetical protein
VRAANGTLLRGARVTIQGQSAFGTQSRTTLYSLTPVLQNINKSVILTVSLTGYVNATRTVTLGASTTIRDVNFVLNRP